MGTYSATLTWTPRAGSLHAKCLSCDWTTPVSPESGEHNSVAMVRSHAIAHKGHVVEMIGYTVTHVVRPTEETSADVTP
jgi:hypothetical protein